MAHHRNDKKAVQARRQRALKRWEENRDRGYRGLSAIGSHLITGKSDPNYVDNQISVLERLTRTSV